MAKPAAAAKRKRDDQNGGVKRGGYVDHEFVDWDELAETKWGETPLTKYLAVPDVDRIVGWATHAGPKAHSNLLVGLSNSPMQPSLLRHLEATATDILVAEKRTDLWEACDQSALVAVGTAVEEMLTASLLPLAQLHAKRCRTLETIPGNEDRLFSEWTLPPEEAIEKLLDSSIPPPHVPVLATAHPSTRSTVHGAGGTSLLSQCPQETRNKEAETTWCAAMDLDPHFVRNNSNVYGIFLPPK